MQSSADEATKLTEEVERRVTLFRELAEGRHDVRALSDEVGALLDLLMRLDREKRWEDVLRIARALCTLLSLLMRWVELVRSLRIALRAAEELGDLDAVAWASHELGSVHLAAEKARTANEMLGRARELREKSGNKSGLATTNHNLQILCQLIRAFLREGRLTESKPLARRLTECLGPHPLALAAIAGALFAGGGVAAAAVSGYPPARWASTYFDSGTASTNASSTGSTGSTSTSLSPASYPAEVPAATITPPSVDFGTQQVGTPSAVKAATLSNSGNATLQVNSVTIVGANRGDFAISSPDCGGHRVAPQSSCTVSVTFTPRSSGPRIATLSFNSQSAQGPPPRLTLSGTGYTTAPSHTASPPSPTSDGAPAVIAINPPPTTTTNPPPTTTTNPPPFTTTNPSPFTTTNPPPEGCPVFCVGGVGGSIG